MVLEKINLGEIVCDSNRRYTKDEGFEQLLNSVNEYGIIEPPVVRPQNGSYHVVAGRRRIEAAKRLKYKTVDCMVMESDDPLNDEEIALTENVNRLEMHPLDEASAFKRMADNGASIEEIARYYARSPSAIYKRLRLVSLIEELKVWFRDGILNISGAAILAELPEEDQKAFYDEYLPQYEGYEEDTNDDIKIQEIDNYRITAFIYKRQCFKINGCFGNECIDCHKRTHNNDNDLFEEYNHLDDVCLDADCYRAKYSEVIRQALIKKKKDFPETEAKIYFNTRGAAGVLERFYKKATHVVFDFGDGTGTRFDVLREKDWEFTGETNRKKDACWEISELYDGKIVIRRIGYKEKKPEEKKAAKGSSFLKDYFGDKAVVSFAAERGMKLAELEKLIESKNKRYDFTQSDIGRLVSKRVITNRIEKEKAGDEPPRNYFNMYLTYRNIELDAADQKEFEKLTGKNSFKDINIPDELQPMFHFLLLTDESGFGDRFDDNVPSLKDVIIGNITDDEKLFMEYAGLDKDAYSELWLKCAGDKLDEILKPKEKTGKNKKTSNKGAAPHGEDVPADASGAGSSTSSTQKKKKSSTKEDGARRCRVCGCTENTPCIDEGGDSCSWVEEDLCSACAEKADEDDYPF